MEIDPTEATGLATPCQIRFFKGRLKTFFPAAKPDKARLYDLAAKQNWRVIFLTRKRDEMGPVFVAARIMGQKVFDGFNLQPPQRRELRTRDPIQLFQWLGILDHSAGTVARIAST